MHDGPGIRTTIFMKGCPLHCGWCHNPESQSAQPIELEVQRRVNGHSVTRTRRIGEEMEPLKVVEVLERDRPFYEESGGGVTFSGGEPLLQAEVLSELLRLCKERELHTAVDTCGFAPTSDFERIAENTDLFLFDLKHMDAGLHKKYTGADNRLIITNADYLLERGAKVLFRVPVIPNMNTTEFEMECIIGFLEKRRNAFSEIHLLPYHKISAHKYQQMGMIHRIPVWSEPDQEFLERIKKRFRYRGLEVTVGG